MKVYCKDCKCFPRWNRQGKRYAKCRAYVKKEELGFYSPQHKDVPKHYQYCCVQNNNNDCLYYKEK